MSSKSILKNDLSDVENFLEIYAEGESTHKIARYLL